MTARQLVDKLLEEAPIRACAACQKEFGIKPLPNTSHGSCRRHTIEFLASIMPLEQATAKVDSKPPESFCPDLSQQHAA